MTVLSSVQSAMDQASLWPEQGRGSILACSAGLDSTVLARVLVPLLEERGHPVVLAHLDHGWREDADEDGPSAMDRRLELEGRTWEVSAEGLTGIELVLQNGL